MLLVFQFVKTNNLLLKEGVNSYLFIQICMKFYTVKQYNHVMVF